MKCQECGREVPQERLEALPHTRTCVRCSKVQLCSAININVLCESSLSTKAPSSGEDK